MTKEESMREKHNEREMSQWESQLESPESMGENDGSMWLHGAGGQS